MHEFTVIAVGHRSPFDLAPGTIATIVSPLRIDLIASLPAINKTEREIFRHGPMRGGLATMPGVTSALLVWRFDGSNPLVFDTAFNVCNNPLGMWGTPEREPHEHIMVNATLQDEFGIVRAFRATSFPPKLMAAIEAAAARQVEAANAGLWTRANFAADVARLHRRWPTARDALRGAVIRADLGV